METNEDEAPVDVMATVSSIVLALPESDVASIS